ncbi:ABC transporter permease [Candidatus Saccharibacteria bacterium]|nr:ABC transporter permease [Candidatus Saccharibacteria bacterium]
MAKGKKKLDSKSYAQQKRHRRQWVTFMRMCRYGINNFTRNAWLTIAATAIMTITLLVVFTSVASRNVLIDTADQVRDRIDMSVYLTTDTTEGNANKIADGIRGLSSVTLVAVETPDQARKKFIEDNKSSADTLEAVTQATNKLPWTLSIKLININDTDQLRQYVETNQLVKDSSDPKNPPSFAGDRRATLESISRAVDFAQKVGIGASIVFVAISTLIIFNTIRMAIFNRREEIQMMKLIGAERSFIRGPFVVEAVVYGFFAAIIASGLGYALLYFAAPSLLSYGINLQPTLDLFTYYAAFVLLGMIAIGALIGIVSSLMATRRYLRL